MEKTDMAIARIFDAPGWTPEQYDALIARMDLGGQSAPGVLFHWAAQTDTGMKAVDVYESRAVADHLIQDKIGPIAAELGLPTAPGELTSTASTRRSWQPEGSVNQSQARTTRRGRVGQTSTVLAGRITSCGSSASVGL